MRILVCGGRDFVPSNSDIAFLRHYLTKPGVVLIHGDYRGADRWADEFAKSLGLTPIPFHADWTKHGKRAGPIRNQRMLDEGKPDLVLAFPGGSGTQDMIERAEKAGVDVIEVGKDLPHF